MENDDLLQDFVVESNEHLEDIESELLAIEGQGDDFDADLVNKVFRALHSIKGASGFLGLERICELSHSMENVLNSIRNHELTVTSSTVDALLKASDRLKSLFEDIGESNNADVAALVAVLEAINAGEDGAATAEEQQSVPELAKQQQAAPEEKVTEVDSAEVDTSEASAPAPQASQQPTPAPAPHGTQKPAGAAAHKAEHGEKGASKATSTVRVSVSVLDRLMNLAGELVLGRNQLVRILGTEDRQGLDSVGSRIDQITSELQEAIMETRMQPIGNVFSKFPRVVRDLSATLGKQVTLITEGNDVELDKTIIEAISDPLTHLVRNSVDHGVESPASRSQRGKPELGTVKLHAFHDGGTVNITITDDGAGIDVDVLKSKAVEKGVITPERAREISDRDSRHLIFHPGFSTKEKVTDISGRGVGMDVVQTNLEKLGGTIEVESELGAGTTIAVKLPLTLAIIPALIVSCGESSFAIPQLNIMELVRVKRGDENTRIEKLKGAEVLRLRGHLLPLVRLDKTLDPGLDVHIGDDAEGIDEVQGEESTEQRLARRRRESTNVIVVAAGKLRYGLVVGDLRDSEEIVVKPLGRHIKDAPCFSGATIMGDGNIALILDVAGIASFCSLENRSMESENANVDAEAASQTGGLQHSVVLFRNHNEERFAVNSGLVRRIDQVESKAIVVVGGIEALQGPESITPVLRLENLITARPFEQRDMIYVLIFEVGRREIGLLIPELEDIRDITTEIDTVTVREPGVAGSVTLEGGETRLIDIYELAERAHPEWFEAQRIEREERFERERLALSVPAEGVALEPTPEIVTVDEVAAPIPVAAAPAADERPSVVLLAEDSGFFRKKVKAYVKAAGYEVVDFEDGLEAWKSLSADEHNVCVVITDVEMPNMSGLDLTREIRADGKWKHVPIIALTSLATEEDIRRGREVGVTDYQIKMDRDRLIESLDKLWREAKSSAGV